MCTRIPTVGSYTFIVYELQFRDGSGLIQFNGAPGELYARRHLVPRSSFLRIHGNARIPVCVQRARARARALEIVYRGPQTAEGGGGKELSSSMLNDNEDNNNLI